MIIDEYGLSPLQEGMLFHHVSGSAPGVDIEQIVIDYDEPLDAVLLERAWRLAVKRHPALRTSFVWKQSANPMQRVHDHVELSLEIQADSDDETGFHEFLACDRVCGFDLAQAPLMRLTLFDYGRDRHRLVWTVHHILLDGRAFILVLNDVEEFYQRLRGGESVEPQPGLALRPYIEWINSLDCGAADKFWADQLQGLKAPTPLLYDAQAPGGQFTGHGAEELRLSRETTLALREVAKRYDITLNTIAMGVWGVLLSRYSGEQDVLFGAAMTTRHGSIANADAVVGLLLNTIPVRANLSSETSIAVALQELRATWLSLRAYEHTPLTRIKEASGFAPSASLFDSLVVFENQSFQTALTSTSKCWRGRQWHLQEQTNFPLTFNVFGDQEMLLTVAFDRRRFRDETAERMLWHARQLFEGIAAHPDRKISELTLLTPAEREQVLYEWNDTEREFPRDKCVHQLFEEQVERDPDAVAVVFNEQRFSYRELNQRANQIAHYLQKLGVGPDRLVGVCLQRSPELVAGLLGVWKAGGAYVPLDPSYPQERLSFMVSDAAVQVLLTEKRCEHLFVSAHSRTVCLDSDWSLISQEGQSNPGSGVTPSNLSYVMYTSGSTGAPKGAMIIHSGLVNYLTWAIRTYRVEAGGSVPVHSSISFDLTVTSLYAPLLAGGQVELLAEDVAGQSLLTALRREKGRSLVKITPNHLELLSQQLTADEIADMTNVFVIGGENLVAEKLRLWREFAPGTRLINEYGPTETVVGCCVYEIQVDDPRSGSVPIGRPIDNTQLYVLYPDLQPVPVGVTGELYIGGAGVARGYLSRPELTAEKFVADPFRGGEARMYRTGDLARYRADGNIECLGRIDHQVKIRGYRIELGEIEVALKEHPEIRQAVVIAREDTPGDKRLVAYLVASAGMAPAPSEVRTRLKQRLPDYMVPTDYVFLEQLPISPNGKIDRKALPAPEVTADQAGEEQYAAPRTLLEQQLAAIWADVLHHQAIGIRQDFFGLGGHSLSAMQVVTRIRKTIDIEVPVSFVFQCPTIESLAKAIEEMNTSMHSEEELLRILEEIEEMPAPSR